LKSGIEKSIGIIKKYQTPEGAYIASPNFSQYDFCWFRDSSFIANSMAEVGERKSSILFYEWGIKVINKQRKWILELLTKDDKNISYKDLLPTRYRPDGSYYDDGWPNGQSDGYGTFLWSIEKNAPSIAKRNSETIKLLTAYLEKIWKVPCFDVWEESPDGIHTSTLLSIAAGLRGAEKLLNIKTKWKEIMGFIVTHLVYKGRLKKSSLNDDVDTSICWALEPFQLFDSNDCIIINTINTIKEKLEKDCGLKRYPTDTYYGGGSWILLTANFGQCKLDLGKKEEANRNLEWVEKHFNKKGELPEQVPENLIDKDKYSYWIEKWGNIAVPLLWSHGNYIDFALAMRKLIK
jgi:GH15 family glucan-1,4-alpha-glucosidase